MHWPLLEVRRLGVVSYADSIALQSELVTARQTGRVSDVLLLLENSAGMGNHNGSFRVMDK